MSRFENKDCLPELRGLPDNHVDLAIVDPPYFDGPSSAVFYGVAVSSTKVVRNQNTVQHWEKVTPEYFVELQRVARKYIFWGCNYYPEFNFHTGRIFWDKVNDSIGFSGGELAATNLFDHLRLFRFMWNGMMQGKSITQGTVMQGNKKLNEKRIHPTQKPVLLYEWILRTFTDPAHVILDTHVGSASSLVACERLGNPYIGYEIDRSAYAKAVHRLVDERNKKALRDRQIKLFEV